MEGTGQSPFAMAINGLDSTDIVENTIQTLDGNNQGTTIETTEAPTGTTEETTTAPEENQEGDAETTFIDELRTQYGVEDALENSPEGLQTLISKVEAKSKEAGIAEKFQAKPILGQLDAHLEAGKSVESFFQVKQLEANKIQPVELTGDEKHDAEARAHFKQVITANYKELGLADKQISRIIESSELEGTLEEDYKDATTAWNGRIDARAQQTLQQEEQVRLQAVEEQKQLIADINSLLDKGKLNGAIIPKEDIQAMKEFTLKEDEQGYTARDKAFSKLSLEQQLVIDYLVFKGFNLKGFVTAKSSTQSLDSLFGRKDHMKGGEQGGGGNAAEASQLPTNIQSLNFSGLQNAHN